LWSFITRGWEDENCFDHIIHSDLVAVWHSAGC
jgi:hypothetical protein